MTKDRFSLIRKGGLFLILTVALVRLEAYTYVQVGVGSNLLIDGNRVLFAQGDGSLTVLALETGEVLKRDATKDYSGTLKSVSEGILVMHYGSIALLSRDDLKVIWETSVHYDPAIVGDVLVSADGNGVVQCRELKDGKVRWTFDLPGALQVVAHAGGVLVHRAATYEEEKQTTTVLLDLETGREMFRKMPPPNVHWDHVNFDGTNIFVRKGTFSGRRKDFKLEALEMWNLAGEEIRNIPVSTRMAQELQMGVLEFEGKTFLYDGSIYSQGIPHARLGLVLPERLLTNDGRIVREREYQVGEGTWLTIRFGSSSPDESTLEVMQSVALRNDDMRWEGSVQRGTSSERIAAVACDGGRFLFGTDLGRVECLEAKTGEPIWLYRFPTVRQTMSFSSGGMPPMMSEAAEIYRRENQNPATNNLIVVSGTSRKPRVIVDPRPMTPFKNLPRYLLTAWLGAVAPLLLLVSAHVHRQRTGGRGRWLGGITMFLTMVPIIICWFYGRVSPGALVALRIAIGSGLVLGIVESIREFRNHKPFKATGLLICFLWAMLWVYPLFRFK